MDFSGKVVVVTGGSAGVGKAIALAFAEKGANVAILSRDSMRLRKVEKEIEKKETRAMALVCDVSCEDEITDCIEKVEKTLGKIDIWVNNAMVTVFSLVKDMSAEEYRRVTEVTYLGSVFGTMGILPRMLSRNSGIIIQVGSALSYRSIPLQSAYCGAKHGIRAFVDSLRVELAHAKSGVKVTMVHLPGLNTPQFSWSRTHTKNKPRPVPPVYHPELAAGAVLFAAEHPERREVFLGSSTLAVIIMNSLFPKIVDEYIKLTGFSSQFRKERVSERRKDNLFNAVDGTFGVEGEFRDEARRKSTQFRLEKVPVLYYFFDIFSGLWAIAKMMPGFVKAYITKNSEKGNIGWNKLRLW